MRLFLLCCKGPYQAHILYAYFLYCIRHLLYIRYWPLQSTVQYTVCAYSYWHCKGFSQVCMMHTDEIVQVVVT
jgi:hypothetical protein